MEGIIAGVRMFVRQAESYGAFKLKFRRIPATASVTLIGQGDLLRKNGIFGINFEL